MLTNEQVLELENLINQKEEQYIKMSKALAQEIYAKLNSISTSALREEEYLQVTYPLFSENKGKWELNLSIHFKEADKKEDFYSEFRITIYEKFIEINFASTSDYTSKDKYLVARSKLILNIWNHEQEIIDLANSIIDLDEIHELDKLHREYENDNYEKKQYIYNQEKQKKEEELKTFKGKYLVRKDLNNEIVSINKIVNITEKNMLLKYCDRKGNEYSNSGYDRRENKWDMYDKIKESPKYYEIVSEIEE